MTYYPEFNDQTLWSVEIALRAMAEDPEYLAESPYSEEECEILARIGQIVAISEDFEPEEDEKDEKGDKWSKLEAQTRKLYKGLMEEQASLGTRDNAEKMSFFRTATSLLDKLVGIQERAANLAKIHQFHDTVLRVMDDILDAGQRTEVMERLKKAIEQ